MDQPTQYKPNQLHRELLGVLGLSPFKAHNSASRDQMFSSHIGQALVINGSTERNIQTGMEREYGKYTFSVKMPVDADIIRVIERYKRTMDINSIRHNPETLVIYEDAATKQVGCVVLTDYFSNHSYFGFPYVRRNAVRKLRTGESIAAGTILADSPSVTEDGGYKPGAECNVAFMTHPAVSEDGIVASRDVLERFKFKTYERRSVEFGSKMFALNLYGDANNYKPHPDIGDVIRPDGRLMALRSYDEGFAPVEQSIRNTMEVDPIFDKSVYVNGAGGKIIDIRVFHDPDSVYPGTPIGMETHTLKYDNARRQYYQEIYNEYRRLAKERGARLQLTQEFHRLVVEAISVVGADNKPKNAQGEVVAGDRVSKLYRGNPLDDWRIEFVIEYEITPTIGFKLTDCHGGKGVICHIAEPHEMPVDKDGNRADLIMDPNATVSRLNFGRLYEQYINAASRDLAKEIKARLGIHNAALDPAVRNPALLAQHPEFENCWQRLMRYYQICSPERMYAWFNTGQYTRPREEHIASILRQGMITLYMPPDNEPETTDIVKQLQAEFPPCYGPVTYTGYSGRQSVTHKPVRIGSIYVILLEKTADDWTAVSSSKVQNFGMLAPISNKDKDSQPIRNQAIRAFGETEVRITTSYMGDLVTAELLDRNNSITTHRQVLESILKAPAPSNIENAIDRNLYPLGNARSLQHVKHLAQCGGWEFAYTPHQPNVPSGLSDTAS